MRCIKVTEEMKQEALREFQEQLSSGRFTKNRIDFTFNLANDKKLEDNEKVIVNVRPEAWLKMWSLVQTESGEIGWHGVVTRHSDKLFEITDILMYPQYVTGVTVQTDDVEYGNWLIKDLSDDQINNLRFHGHSHVNMGVSPSGVDTAWYNDILQGLSEEDYYIFAILNKREDYFIEIYDLKTNTIYEKKDIIINVIMSDNNYLQNWVAREKANMIKETKVVTLKSDNRLGRALQEAKKETDLEDDFEDYILNLTPKEMKNKVTMKRVMQIINSRAVYNDYYDQRGKWYSMTDEEKVDAVQDFIMENGFLASSKKDTPKYTQTMYDRYDRWRDEYGLYD